MASLNITMATAAATTTAIFSSPFCPKTTVQQQRFKMIDTNRTHRFQVSCNVASDNPEKQPSTINTEPQNLILPGKPSLDMRNVDRRNLLMGLGGLYSAVNLTTLPSSFAAPIAAPSDISKCQDADVGFIDPNETVRGKACCPPVLSKKPIKDFVFPTDHITRTRPALHRLTPKYKDDFKKAIKAMKDLPDDHPHSWKQQAKIHCAYCNGGYTQEESGFPNKELQVHNSWLFFPFHRWYLYFFERIMGKLINDPTFALPYWNWDNPAGMDISFLFEEDGKKNPLFDAYRDARHLPPAIVDLEYAGSDRNLTCLQQISENLSAMHKQMISNAKDTDSFFGGHYIAGMDPYSMRDPSVGSIEAGCHTAVHRWVGNSRMPNNEDLGNFYSAGYDPLFYVHHANVDRLWTIWKGLKWYHREPRDDDWRNASYVFYDENEELVRVYNKDSVKIEKLKYNYEKSDTPWEKSRSNPRFRKSGIASLSVGKVKTVDEEKFPLKLGEGTVKVLVKRPETTKRTKEEKEEVGEMLILKIECDSEKFVKIDVYVNDASADGSTLSPTDSEFAGSFAQLPHNHMKKMPMKSGARFGLTELLEDIEAEEDEFVLVSLVPKSGCDDVTISEIKIELVDHTA